MTGTVAKYIEPKGYGFIKPADGEKDIFFHVKAIREGAHLLHEGSGVSYEESMDKEKRPRAAKVRVLS